MIWKVGDVVVYEGETAAIEEIDREGNPKINGGFVHHELVTSPFELLGAELGRLVTEKQAAYGDSFGKAGQIMRILYPNGIALEQMDDALTVVRIVDKLFRIATDRDAFGESPFRDIAGYGILGASK